MAARRAAAWSRFHKHAALYAMALPGLVYLFINNYMPLSGIVIAFKQLNYRLGIWGSPWVGLDNFKYLFITRDAYLITRNTILYNLAFLVLNTVVGVLVAIVLNEVRSRRLLKVYQTSILLPHLISMVIVSYLAYAFLSVESGLLNKHILPALGLSPVSWYVEPKAWPWILMFVNTWKHYGYLTVVYFATIVGFDRAYYEAAMLDGAGKLQQIRHITLPLLRPVIIMMTLLALGKVFYADFGLFYQVPMNSGLLAETTDVIDTYVYRGMMVLGDTGMAAAAGVYQSLVGFVLVMVSNFTVKKIYPENSLF